MPARLVALLLTLGAVDLSAQRAAILRDVPAVHVLPTVVVKPDKVKEDFAPTLVADMLKSALEGSRLKLAEDAPIRAHIALEEFSSGSNVKRFVVGFGAGRSTVAGRLIFADVSGKELASVRLHVRGQMLFNAYQGANNQRQQATNNFEQKLREEIARLK